VQILACCSADGVDLYRDGGHGVGNTNFLFTRSQILGVYDTCSHVHSGMIPNQPSCTGYGIGDGGSASAFEHDDGFAISDCQSCSWIDSGLYDAGAQPWFAQEFNGGVIANTSFNGNVVVGDGAPSSGGAGVNIGSFGGGATSAYAGTFNFLYNTLVGVIFQVYTIEGGVDHWAPGATINLTGNLSEGDNAAYGGSGNFHFPGFKTVDSSGTNSGCSNNGSNLTLNYSYNWLYDVGPCAGTGNVNLRSTPKSVAFGSFAYPYDLHLASGSAGVDVGDTSCSSIGTDLDGDTRYAGASCDVGADESH
jgi:hypothetical protein